MTRYISEVENFDDYYIILHFSMTITSLRDGDHLDG